MRLRCVELRCGACSWSTLPYLTLPYPFPLAPPPPTQLYPGRRTGSPGLTDFRGWSGKGCFRPFCGAWMDWDGGGNAMLLDWGNTCAPKLRICITSLLASARASSW